MGGTDVSWLGIEMRWGCAGGGCSLGPRDPSACRRGRDFLCVPGHAGVMSSTAVGASVRKGKAMDRGRSIPTAPTSGSFTLSPAGSAPLQTRAGTQRHPPSPAGVFSRRTSLPSARNSQLQEDTLPGRQAPCAQDASSMSSPLSLGGEHRADGHASAATLQRHTRVAPPLTGT